jgi:ADP-ribose pyrophosphatase YjhB (NUDIX family)
MRYIKNLRTKIGSDKLIHPGARIIIENDQGAVLFIVRQDTGSLGLPAGALEFGETIEDCIRREVKEETGLDLVHLELIGISTDPEHESVVYPNGDQVQYFTMEFFSTQWKGTLQALDWTEVKKAQFLPPSRQNELPPNEQRTFQSLVFYKTTGKVHLS